MRSMGARTRDTVCAWWWLGLFTPTLSGYVQLLGGGGLVYGVIMSAFDVGRTIGAPLLGRWVVAAGYRPVFCAAFAAAACAHFSYVMAESWGVYALIPTRLLAGFST